jgi:hypothetical protein
VSAPPWLADAQARIRALVTAPEGVAEALRESGDPDARALAQLVRGDRGLSPVARLGVYANAFFERLRGALAKDFPDLARALGDDAFHDLVRVYLMLHPPHRPSIREAGASLAAFLADDEVAAPFRRRLPCAADLAAFEWAQTEAFDAPDAPLLAGETLAAVSPDAWPALRLETIPALRLLRVAWPVQTLADDAGPEAAAALAPRAAFLRVWRREERVRWREIPEREHAALACLLRGDCFGEVCAQIARDVGDEAAATEAAGLLTGWLADGCLRERSRP